MPKREPSSSRPIALVKSPLPSASIRMSVPTPWFSPQAFITNTSLTETQAMVSTPLAFRLAVCCLKLGRCLAEQVGVKAPGTAKIATFLPLSSWSVVSGPGPSGPKVVKLAAGTLSPTLIVMSSLLRAFAAHRTGSAPSQARAANLRLESATTGSDHMFDVRLGRAIPHRTDAGGHARHRRSAFRARRDLPVRPQRRARDGPDGEPASRGAQHRQRAEAI